MESLLHCGYQYELKHQAPGDGSIAAPQTVEALFIGTVFHAVSSEFYTSHMETGGEFTPSIDDMLHVAARIWNADKALVRWGPGGESAAFKLLLSLVRGYIEWASAQISTNTLKPTSTERYIELELDNCYIVGTLDGETDEPGIFDLKTCATYDAGKEIAKSSIQPQIYSLLATGGDVDAAADLAFDFHLVTKRPNVSVYVHRVYSSRRDLEIVRDTLIPRAANMVMNGMFLPNFTYQWCHPKWCEVWQSCRGA